MRCIFSFLATHHFFPPFFPVKPLSRDSAPYLPTLPPARMPTPDNFDRRKGLPPVNQCKACHFLLPSLALAIRQDDVSQVHSRTLKFVRSHSPSVADGESKNAIKRIWQTEGEGRGRATRARRIHGTIFNTRSPRVRRMRRDMLMVNTTWT